MRGGGAAAAARAVRVALARAIRHGVARLSPGARSGFALLEK